MAERLTATKVKSCPMGKDMGCVFRGRALQETVPCRSSHHKHTGWVTASSQVLALTRQRRGLKGSDETQSQNETEGDGICGFWDESPSGFLSQRRYFIYFSDAESNFKLEGGKENTFDA
jgi:hypothetical protein